MSLCLCANPVVQPSDQVVPKCKRCDEGGQAAQEHPAGVLEVDLDHLPANRNHGYDEDDLQPHVVIAQIDLERLEDLEAHHDDQNSGYRPLYAGQQLSHRSDVQHVVAHGRDGEDEQHGRGNDDHDDREKLKCRYGDHLNPQHYLGDSILEVHTPEPAFAVAGGGTSGEHCPLGEAWMVLIMFAGIVVTPH